MSAALLAGEFFEGIRGGALGGICIARCGDVAELLLAGGTSEPFPDTFRVESDEAAYPKRGQPLMSEGVNLPFGASQEMGHVGCCPEDGYL